MSDEIKLPEKALEERTVSLMPLLKLLECPVCLGMGKIPFKLCQRGHLLCVSCTKKLQICPICSGSFSMENPICVLKTLIESLPRPCQNDGCKDIVEPLSDHQTNCAFRVVECKRCDKEIPVHQLRAHSYEHPKRALRVLDNNFINLTKYLESSSIYILSFFLFNTWFWLILSKNAAKDIMIIDFEGVFTGKPTNDYFIILRFEKDEVGPSVKLKASEKSIVTSGEGGLSSSKQIISTLKHCLNDEGSLRVDYEMFQKAKAK